MKVCAPTMRPGSMFAACFLVITMALGGCMSTRSPLTSEAERQGDYGTVIIGQGADWSGSYVTSMGLADCEDIKVSWGTLDTDLPAKKVPELQTNLIGCEKPGVPRFKYNILKVPPGAYALKHITHKAYSTHGIRTVYFKYEKDSIYGSKNIKYDNEWKYDTNTSWKFKIDRGDVVYVGDILYSGKVTHNNVSETRLLFEPRLINVASVTMNHEAAVAALKEKHPEIIGDVIDRPLIRNRPAKANASKTDGTTTAAAK